ncbi:MAG: RdgB/HAM1 family non-canonical purine NTP pyrophosphatase [Flavobacteriales bacterium]
MKAQQVFSQTKWICVSDDSGIEVDALEGRPGVFSARFAGENATDEENRSLLLKCMLNEKVRTARFKTVICLCSNHGYAFFEGVLEGSIAHESSGLNGFGYDSIFIPLGETRTLAELTMEEKNAMSHRGIALKKLSDYLRKMP